MIIGYSIGSGLAVRLAHNNQPIQLILLAPYHSLKSLVKEKIPLVPSFILKYKLESDKYIGSIKAPIFIFHGDMDEVIPHSCSMVLEKKLKPSDAIYTLKGQSHNGIDSNYEYLLTIKQLMDQSHQT